MAKVLSSIWWIMAWKLLVPLITTRKLLDVGDFAGIGIYKTGAVISDNAEKSIQ